MSDNYVWTIIVLVTLGNMFMRMVFVEAYGKIKLHPLVERGLAFVPAAVLSSIIMPAVLMPNKQFVPLMENPKLWAALVAALVAWHYRSIFRTLLAGMATLWLLQWLFG